MSTYTRILFYHQGALGDFILALPVIESLHCQLPDALFTVVAGCANLSLISSRPYLEKAISKDLACLASLFSETAFDHCRIKSLLGFPFDKAFLFGKTRLEVLAENIAKFNLNEVYRICSFPDPNYRKPVTEFIFKQLAEQGLKLPLKRPVVAPDPREKEKGVIFAKEVLKAYKKIIVIHPGSGSPKKIWPIPCWRDLLNFLGKYPDVAKIILCGPADEEVVYRLSLEKYSEDVKLIKKWPLPHVVGLLEMSSLFIGNDSGITHLAAVLDVPTVAIFGQSDPVTWGPRGRNVNIIETSWTYPENIEISSKKLSQHRESESLIELLTLLKNL